MMGRIKNKGEKKKENIFLAILDKTSNAVCLQVGRLRGDGIFPFT